MRVRSGDGSCSYLRPLYHQRLVLVPLIERIAAAPFPTVARSSPPGYQRREGAEYRPPLESLGGRSTAVEREFWTAQPGAMSGQIAQPKGWEYRGVSIEP